MPKPLSERRGVDWFQPRVVSTLGEKMRSYYAESVRKFATRQRFQRWDQNIFLPPRVVASSNPGLELVNAFGVQIRVGASSKLGLELVNAFGVQIRTPFGA